MSLCSECGRPIEAVDLYGTPFFEHAPKRDRMTWWHIDRSVMNHQAQPTIG